MFFWLGDASLMDHGATQRGLCVVRTLPKAGPFGLEWVFGKARDLYPIPIASMGPEDSFYIYH